MSRKCTYRFACLAEVACGCAGHIVSAVLSFSAEIPKKVLYFGQELSAVLPVSLCKWLSNRVCRCCLSCLLIVPLLLSSRQ